MFDDLLGELFGEAVSRRLGNSRRAQLLVRVFFGLLGAGLGIGGAVHCARWPGKLFLVSLGALFMARILFGA